MRNSMRALPVTLGVVVLLAACSSGGGASSTPSPSPSPLAGTSWTLTSYAPVGSTTTRQVPASVTATADFTDTRVSGSGGCNNFSAPYTATGTSIDVGAVAATLKACAEPASGVEQAYLQQLDVAKGFTVEAATLTLTDSSGKALLVFVAATPADLVGPTWKATGINNGKQAVSSPVAGSTVTARFGTNGTVSGSGGCNNYAGPFTSTTSRSGEGTLTFLSVQSLTQTICSNTAVTQQERAYFAALANAATYRIAGRTLQVRDSGGALLVSYTTI